MVDFDTFLSAYVAEHGPLTKHDRKVVERLRPPMERIGAWANRDKECPFDATEFVQVLKDLRTLIDYFREARGAEKDAEYEAGVAAMTRLEELFDPEKRLLLFVRFLRDRMLSGISPELIAAAVTAYTDLPVEEKKSVRYMSRMIGSEDAFGVVVRGHVLIENMLDTCIYKYVPHPLDLFNDLKLFIAEKIKLAHMLGIIDEAEKQMLIALNNLRNKVAHVQRKFPDTAEPQFDLTWAEEKSLWSLFIRNDAMSGEWPEYNRDEFPQFLRYIYLHVYTVLSSRATTLGEHALKPIYDIIKPDAGQRLILPVMTIMFSKMFKEIENAALDETRLQSQDEAPKDSHLPPAS